MRKIALAFLLCAVPCFAQVQIGGSPTAKVQVGGAGTGLGCTTSGPAGTIPAGDGSGGCETTPADYNATLANSFTFNGTSGDFNVNSVNANFIQTAAENFAASAAINFIAGTAINLSSAGGSWDDTSSHGIILNESASTGDIEVDNGGSGNIQANSSGGIELDDNSTAGIQIDEGSTGPIQLGADEIDLFGGSPGTKIFGPFTFNGFTSAGSQCLQVDAAGLVSPTGVVCGSGSGSGTVTGQASGVIPLGTSATVIGNQSHLDDGNTTAATITSTEPIAVAVAGGQGGTADLTEGTTAAATAGHDVLYADSTAHCIKQSLNGGSFACLGTGSGSGYTNVTGSATQTTVAALNTLCGSGTLYATTPLSIATGGTLSCPAQFSKAGLWTIASGQTVTFAFPVTKTDAPSQIFAGSGTVVFSPNQTLPPIDWFGATNYPSKSAAVAGTDSAPALAACLAAVSGNNQCLIPLGFYRLNSTITDAATGVGILGVANGNQPGNGGIAGLASVLVFTGATTADVIDVAPASNYLYNNAFNNFAISRSAFGTGTSKGLSVTKCAACIVANINSNDSIEPFYFNGLPSYATGVIEFNSSYWGFDGNTPAGTRSGFVIDTANNPQSMQMNFNQVATSGGSGATKGFDCNGVSIGCTDIFGLGNSTNNLTLGSSWVNPQDLHWLEEIDDQDQNCMKASGTNGTTSADLSGGWCRIASGGTTGVDLENTSGIIVTHKQISAANSVTQLMLVNNTVNFSIVGNSLGNAGNSGTNCVTVTGTSSNGTISNNPCSGLNSFTGFALGSGTHQIALIGNPVNGNQFVNGITFVNSSNNTVQGNPINTSATGSTGISADVNSNNNVSFDANTIVGPATLISDLGTNNRAPIINVSSAPSGACTLPTPAQYVMTTGAFWSCISSVWTQVGSGSTGISGATSGQALIAGSATTATSSKALAGSGAGLTTGPTTSVLHNCPDFSNTSGQLEDSGSPCSGGSAFITSLTTTGTSGPSTVTSGVLNIPQYTGGGGGGLFGPIISIPTLSSTGFSTTVGTSLGSYVGANTSLGVQVSDQSHASTTNPYVEGQVGTYPVVAFTATGLFSIPPALYQNYAMLGFMAMNTTSGANQIWGVSCQDIPCSTNTMQAYGISNTNLTTFSATIFTGVHIAPTNFMWMRYKDDGTHIIFSVSTDGIFFTQINSLTKSSSPLGSSGYNFFGIGVSEQTTSLPVGFNLMSYTFTTP